MEGTLPQMTKESRKKMSQKMLTLEERVLPVLLGERQKPPPVEKPSITPKTKLPVR